MTPNRVTTHPGEILREEFLKPLGPSVNALATRLRVPAGGGIPGTLYKIPAIFHLVAP